MKYYYLTDGKNEAQKGLSNLPQGHTASKWLSNIFLLGSIAPESIVLSTALSSD